MAPTPEQIIQSGILSFKNIQSTINDFDLETGNVRSLKVRLNQLQAKYQEMKSQLPKLTDPAIQTKFETLYFDTHAAIETLIDLLEPQVEISSTSGISSASLQALPPHSLTKIPKLEIKKFTGQIEDWSSFSQIFKSLIMKRNDLENVVKLHYLLSHLEGEPHDLIKEMPLTSTKR